MQLNDVTEILWNLGEEFGFRFDIPLELEAYFEKLIHSYDGPPKQIGDWLRKKIKEDFLTLREMPNWSQDPEWPVFRGRPMIFVGQIDREVELMNVSFFLFKDHESGVTTVITQVVGT